MAAADAFINIFPGFRAEMVTQIKKAAPQIWEAAECHGLFAYYMQAERAAWIASPDDIEEVTATYSWVTCSSDNA
ncbi:hypothetical protein C8N43_1622 [Litoreibacter ponti]|uniref:Uncharacterized protein n=1 Tax=Litoreibacter ponti TaxID=1510457 RepID=A0A2T6BLU6_9RHOB|nr:hypothetical protein C8N43_1622 [Litoreibacter ponti]